jgi:16S rRNA (uracil1498-N3)-methyltransferase
MNLILLFKEDFIDDTNRVRLEGRRLKHVLEVHRANPGEILCVGLMNSMTGTGCVTLINDKVLEMDIHFDQEPPEKLPLNLILALPRPKVLSRIIQCASSMGVKNIWLVNSARVEKSFWQSPRLSGDNLHKQLVLGLEQSKDTVLPEIITKKFFKRFVEDDILEIINGTQAFVAHPHAATLCPREVKSPITLAIGPEGGFIPYEIEKLTEFGFTPVQMGERILKVESAVPALIGRMF